MWNGPKGSFGRTGQNLLRLDSFGEPFQDGLQFEQQRAGDAERGAHPDEVALDQRSRQVSGESGHFGGKTRAGRNLQLVLVSDGQLYVRALQIDE